MEKIPKDKISELYDVIHLFRMDVESRKKAPKDRRSEAEIFFGIWKGMPPEETSVLDDIHLRRKRTFRERIL